MDHISKLLDALPVNSNTVNSKEKTDSTVNSKSNKQEDLVEKICQLIKSENVQPEGIALKLAELLDDKRSLPYYLLLAKEHNPGELFAAAYQAKEKAALGQLRAPKAVYFIGILRRKGFKTKFR